MAGAAVKKLRNNIPQIPRSEFFSLFAYIHFLFLNVTFNINDVSVLALRKAIP